MTTAHYASNPARATEYAINSARDVDRLFRDFTRYLTAFELIVAYGDGPQGARTMASVVPLHVFIDELFSFLVQMEYQDPSYRGGGTHGYIRPALWPGVWLSAPQRHSQFIARY